MLNILMYSGGKDSTASVILAHENNEPIDIILMGEVRFSDTISGENPEHIKFIKEVAIPKFEEWGYKCLIVSSDNTLVKQFHKVKIRGKHVGNIYGFPSSGLCYANSLLKVGPINKYLKGKKYLSIEGIAIDEPKRLERMHASRPQASSLLEKYQYTELMAKDLCKEYGLLSPVYKHTKRGGCWFCPNKGIKELRTLRDNYPELWNKLLELDSTPNKTYETIGYGKSYTLIEKQFKEDDNQLSIFDYID